MACCELPPPVHRELEQQRRGGRTGIAIILRLVRAPRDDIHIPLLTCQYGVSWWTPHPTSGGPHDRHRDLRPPPTAACSAPAISSRLGNYAPVADELTEYDLAVEGAIPAELDGWYLRNGPNPRTGDRPLVHRRRHDPRRPHRGRPRQVVPQPLGAHRQLRRGLPALQRRRHPQPARQRRQHPRRQPRGQDAGAGRVVAALRDHQRPGDRRRLRLRRQARRLDDRAPEDLPDHRRAALLRLRQHLRAARHLSPRRRQRRAGRSTGRSTSRR